MTRARDVRRTPRNVPKVRIRLKTAQDVKRFLARLIREAYSVKERGESVHHYRLGMLATMLLKSIEATDFENRIANLERVMLEGKKG